MVTGKCKQIWLLVILLFVYVGSSCIERMGSTWFVSQGNWSLSTNSSTDYPLSSKCFDVQWRHGCCAAGLQNSYIAYNGSTWHDCSGNFNALLKSMRGLKVCIAGDSMSFNTFKAFHSQLLTSNISHQHITTNRGANGQRLDVPQYNASMELIEFYQLKLPETVMSQHMYKNIQHLYLLESSQLQEYIQECGHFIISIGLHYGVTETHVAAFTQVMRWIRDALENDMQMSAAAVANGTTKAALPRRHFYRLTYPQHFASKPSFDGKPPSGDYGLAEEPRHCVRSAQRHWSDVLAQGLFQGSPVHVLDYYNVLREAGEYHSVFSSDDCSHFCWNHRLWAPLWGLLESAFQKRV